MIDDATIITETAAAGIEPGRERMSITLSGEELSDLQNFMGKRTRELFEQHAKDFGIGTIRAASPERQETEFKKIVEQVAKDGKVRVLRKRIKEGTLK